MFSNSFILKVFEESRNISITITRPVKGKEWKSKKKGQQKVQLCEARILQSEMEEEDPNIIVEGGVATIVGDVNMDMVKNVEDNIEQDFMKEDIKYLNK